MKKKIMAKAVILLLFVLFAAGSLQAEYLDTLWSKNLMTGKNVCSQFTPDGNFVIFSRENKLYKFDAWTGDSVSTFPDECDSIIMDLYISKNGNYMITWDFKQEYIYLWDYNQETISKRINLYSTLNYRVLSTLITNDEKYAVLSVHDKNNWVLIFYGIAEDSIIKTFSMPYEMSIRAMALSPDGHDLAIARLYSKTKQGINISYLDIYDIDSLKYKSTIGQIDRVVGSLRYSPDGKLLTCGDEYQSNPMLIWDLETKTKIKEIHPLEDTTHNFTHGAFTKNNDFIVMTWSYYFDPCTIIYDYHHDSVLFKLPNLGNKSDVYPDSNLILLNGRILYVFRLNPGTNGIADRGGRNGSMNITAIYKKDKINLNFELTKPEAIEVKIYDFNGVLVNSFNTGWLESGKHNLTQTLNLSSGVYFVKLKSESISETKKFVVVR